jgi:hypothetical protein
MRASPDSFIACSTSDEILDTDNRRFIVVQSADPVDLKTQVMAAIAVLLNDDIAWEIAFVDLAGGGDGHTFVFMMEIVNPAEFEHADGQSLIAFDMANWLASEQEALTIVDNAALAASVVGQEAAIFQTMVAGACKGTRFMGLETIQRT